MTYIGKATIDDTKWEPQYAVGDIVSWRSKPNSTRYIVKGFEGYRVVLCKVEEYPFKPMAEWFVKVEP